MLTIKHLTGALAGEDVTIDRNVEKVVFGRQADCDVVFPPEATLVSRHHFALVRKASGDWTIDLFGEPFVAIDGQPAEQGQVVRDGTKLELGKRGGPSLQTLVTRDTRPDNYEVTEKQETFEGARSIAERARKGATTARIAGVAAVIVAIGAAAFGVSQYFSSKTSNARLDDALQQFNTSQKEVAQTNIGSAVRDKLIKSVYMVLVENTKNGGLSGVGTAWPVGLHLLGTNAHVAAVRDELKPDTVMEVRSPGADGRIYKVTAHRIHPGYKALTEFRTKDPIGMKNAQGVAVGADMVIPGYDVALLEVKEELPKDDIFKLAKPAQYKSLRAGQPIATAGYPAEQIVSSKAGLIRATPEFHLGTITGITNFFFLPADDDHRQLIHDDLPTAGGASGSPIVDNSGDVVALLNAGNMYMLEGKGMPGRMPSAALVNYAQRVDMLRDLLDNTQDKTVQKDRPYWEAQVAYFKRGIDLLIPPIVEEAKPKPDAAVTTLLDKPLKLTEADKQPKKSGGMQRQAVTPVTITKGSTYVFVAYGYEQAPLELYLMVGKNIVDTAKGSWFPSLKYRTDASGGDKNVEAWFPMLKAADRKETEVQLWVVSPNDKDVNYVLRAYKIDAKQPSG